MMENTEDKKKLEIALDEFLKDSPSTCNTEECKIKEDKSIVERINKRIITEDGRQLLI